MLDAAHRWGRFVAPDQVVSAGRALAVAAPGNAERSPRDLWRAIPTISILPPVAAGFGDVGSIDRVFSTISPRGIASIAASMLDIT